MATTRTATPPRGEWSSRIGFILAAMGSAVGFGSIARFPMNVANNGGAAFVLLYAGIMLLVGVPMMIAEFSLGRSAGRNTVGAFRWLTRDPKTPWRGVGTLYFLIAAFFLSWYAVAAGWVLRYVFASITGAYFDDPPAYFFDADEGSDALLWHAAVMVLTVWVAMGGIAKGIERVNLVMMPALFAIILLLGIFAATLGNVLEGYTFYLRPDFTAITLGVVTAAVGQAFFSLSLAQGAMMTYASYLPKGTSLASNSLMIAGSTLIFATACGFMVFPMLAAFDLLGTGAAGLGLIFGPLPAAFAAMGSPIGNLVGTLFFTATFFAAFTSAISLTEPAIAYLVEEKRIPRSRAAILVSLAIYTAGILPAFSRTLLGIEGGVITDVFVILGGLLLALFVGWSLPAKQARRQMDASDAGLKLSFYAYPLVRYVMPGVLAFLLFFSLLGTPCALSGNGASPGVLEGFFGWDLLGCRVLPVASP